MINIDDRLLENVDQSELFLLCHIVKRLNRGMFCFPANKTLLKDTGWALQKLQQVKRRLVEMGYLSIETRFSKEDRQTTNIYKVKTSLIGAYVGGDRLSTPPENQVRSDENSGTTDSPENQATEVLTREEVLSSVSNDTDTQIAIEDLGVPPEEERKKNKQKKEVDPCYQEFVRLWTEQYPLLGFNALAGSKIKSLIKSTREILSMRTEGILRPSVIKEEDVNGLFGYILAFVKRENHWIHGKDIAVFESKYRSIITEIKSGKRTSQGQPSYREIINNL